jgi:hypothetical protein
MVTIACLRILYNVQLYIECIQRLNVTSSILVIGEIKHEFT